MKDGLQRLSQNSGVWSSVLQFLQPRELCLLNCLSKDCWLVHDNDIAWHLAYLRTFHPISALWADFASPTKHTVIRNKASYVATFTAMMENIAAIKEDNEAVEAVRAQPEVEERRRVPRLSENVIEFVIVLVCGAGAALLGYLAYTALYAGDRSVLARVMEQQVTDSQSAKFSLL